MRATRTTALVMFACLSLSAWKIARAAGEEDPQQLMEDVRILQLIRRLDLTPGQMQRILPEVESVGKAVDAAAAEREKLRVQYADALDGARQALVAGKAPSKTVQSRVQKLVQAAQEIDATLATEMADCEARVERSLTPQQLDLIETATQKQAREARIRELDGQPTAAAYVVKKLSTVREMLPDEYAAARLRLANEIAQKVEGARSRRFNVFRQQTLRMLDDVYQWPDEDWQKNKDTLGERVVTYLKIRPESNPRPASDVVPYEQYRDLLRSPRTPVILRELLGGGETEAPAAEPPAE